MTVYRTGTDRDAANLVGWTETDTDGGVLAYPYMALKGGGNTTVDNMNNNNRGKKTDLNSIRNSSFKITERF